MVFERVQQSQPLTRYSWLSLLRAYGVVLVLVYHFMPTLLPGGFIGVDIFFVFSGFLITSLLIREYSNSGHIKLRAFYIRRFRRLFPALLAMLVILLPLALLISPDLRVGIARQTAAALGWVTNYFEILTGKSYADQLLPHLFVHTWTLSVEMQYYLLWGAALFALTRHFGRTRKDGSHDESHGKSPDRSGLISRAVTLAVLVTVLSFALMQFYLIGTEDPSRSYFDTSSHLFPLMLGSVAGLIAGFDESSTVLLLQRIPARLALVLTVLLLSVIAALACFLHFEDVITYRMGILVTAICTTGVILIGRGMQQQLSSRPEPVILKYLADRSYSIYLFHWPLFIVISGVLPAGSVGFIPQQVIAVIAALLALSATLVCAHLSFLFVEEPFRSSFRPLSSATRRWFTPPVVCAYALLFCFLAGMSAYVLHSAPGLTSIERDFRTSYRVLDRTQLEATLADAAVEPGNPPLDGSDKGGELGKEKKKVQKLSGVWQAGGSVTVIGDSVTLGAVAELQQLTQGGSIDAEISRGMYEGSEIVSSLDAKGELGEYVVIALATNSHLNSYDAVEQIMSTVSPGHRLIFVTSYGAGGNHELSEHIRTVATKYPYVTIAEWEYAIQGRDKFLSEDHQHLGTQEAVDIYVQVINEALFLASKKQAS